MNISNKTLLSDFVQKHSRATNPLNKWINEVLKASWRNHNELKETFPSADYVGNGRYVFNIGGNNYRIVTIVLFINGVMDIRFIGTHAEYSKLKNCTEV